MMTKTERFERLRAMPCCCGCGRPAPSDVAHSNFSEDGKGMGIKADDMKTIPMHRVCHQKFDGYTMGFTREQSRRWFNLQLNYINEVLDAKDQSVF